MAKNYIAAIVHCPCTHYCCQVSWGD